MAEIAALGLAANIITFVDFGFRVVSQARKVRDSIHGTTAEAEELNLILQDVKKLNETVLNNRATGTEPTRDEERLLAMARECQNISTQLRESLSALTMRDGRSKSIESVRVVISSFLHERSISSLQKRLESLETRIRSNLTSALQNDHNKAISKQLTGIQQWYTQFELDYDAKLDLLRSDVVQLATQARVEDVGTNSSQLVSLRSKLDYLASETMSCEDHISVLKSLWYPVLRRRETMVPTSVAKSNQWIFDPGVTSFVEWLSSDQSEDRFFVITGRAGSGKSTLMKYICAEPRTLSALGDWASPSKLCTAQYFFWNQGHAMEMSHVGLLQSIVYQILRSIPRLMSIVKHEHIEHEDWSVAELQTVLQAIAEQDELDVKFCFFIDGLDEYNGEEEDLCHALQALSMSKNIKICASTRPRRIFEEFFDRQSRTIDIAAFTRNDMCVYVRRELQNNKKLRDLENSDPTYTELINSIAKLAQGVWLWVYLVAIDVRRAINRDEKISKLKEIVQQFPANLEAHFERMIEAIRQHYREDMSRIFLIASDELQPLPIYAISLLDDEHRDPNYAISRAIAPIDEAWLVAQLPIQKSWLNNRCGDLLIVDDEPHPVFLRNSVDFLHRTVREFLKTNYKERLTITPKDDFRPTVSLAKMCLAMLKSLPVTKFRDHVSLNRILALTDEILYYAHETERRYENEQTPLVAILDQVDRVNTYYAAAERLHWSNARDPATETKFSRYNEGASCNFLALTIQARLVKYVRAKLEANPFIINKRGRPLLDYALRPRRTTPISMPYHSQRDDPYVSVDMIKLLLEHGANPNQVVHPNNERTVWASFLLCSWEMITPGLDSLDNPDTHVTQKAAVSPTQVAAWYKACEILVEYGARTDSSLDKSQPEVIAKVALEAIFGVKKTESLCQLMKRRDEQRQWRRMLCTVL